MNAQTEISKILPLDALYDFFYILLYYTLKGYADKTRTLLKGNN